MKKTTKTVIALVVLIAVALAAFFIRRSAQPEPIEGDKTLTVCVIHGDGSEKDFTVTTYAEYLRGALEEIELVSGDESEYGLFITTVDGETANADNQQWWCITKDGVMTETGVDTTSIADGEQYELTLTTGW